VKGGYKNKHMKTLLLTVITGIGLLLSPSLYADTITEGKLVFSCPNCGPTSYGIQNTIPSKGSFSFDNTTDQFLTISTTWDGVVFNTFPQPANPLQVYDELLVGTLQWAFTCIFQFGLACDQKYYVVLYDATNYMGLSSGTGGFQFSDTAGGTVGVRALHDPVVDTPEPSALTLAFLGLLASVGILVYRQGLRKHDR
jgi:hypothetical protein